MKIRLAATLIVALLVPSLMLVSGAGAANPHPGTPPGQGGDPSASCGGSSGSKPGSCLSPDLPYSDGCLHGQAPVQNPHCQPATTPPTTPTTPTSPTTPTTGVAPTTPAPQSGVAGATAGSKKNGSSGNSGNVGAATAANPANPNQQLAFTGLNAVWLALMGAGLLGSGLVLRARSGSSA
jgi:hypothetical protein